ncbi:MAG: DNA polymerase ligase N-terminal domain-containing protein, partial [Planctomycetota bacterium]
GAAGPRELHWDLMLEFGDSLRTWALSNEPRVGEAIPADELPRHRLDYLDYEGPVSRDRGNVSRFDGGAFDVVEDSPGRLFVDLRGKLLQGRLQLAYDPTNQRWIAVLMPS